MGRWEFFWNSRRYHLGLARAEASRHPTHPLHLDRGEETWNSETKLGYPGCCSPEARLWGSPHSPETQRYGCMSLAMCWIPAMP